MARPGFAPSLPARRRRQIEFHGLSAFGDLAYPPDFQHFRYVDPAAPKGGTFSQIGPDRQYNQNFLTFNSLNSYILKGDAAQGMELTFATLLARAGDEPDAMYGFAAAKVRRSADGVTYRFLIRPEAKFHDGTPLTAHDVAYSLTVLKDKGHPIITQLLRDFLGATADDDTTSPSPSRRNGRATCRCSSPDCLFFPAPIMRRSRSINRRSTCRSAGALTASGVSSRAASSRIERVKDFWGADLPVSRGFYNFDVVRYEFYRDRDVGFEGFTAKTICSARSSLRGSGRPVTISRP